MKQKDLFNIHTNQLITLLTCYNSHMLQANSKEKEQTVLDEIDEAIQSYRTKMTKAQLK
jgi:hydroxymethylpyrimidine/phosphomethylpyrimidine kinase